MGGLVFRRIVTAAAVFAALGVAASSAQTDLTPHRALYTMSLQTASRASDVASLGGRMLVEIADACDGWTLEQRIALTIVNYEGDEIRSYTSFTSWESKDGQRFRFEQQTKQGGVTVDELSGAAELHGAEGGTATLTKPHEAEIALPPGTVFPNQHTEMLVAKAEAGEMFFSRVVFDGTSIDNPNLVSAFIGAPTTAPGLAGEDQAPEVWPVRLAFFHVDSQSPEPDVEIGILLQKNGVARGIELDYGSFVIEGRLDALELLPPMGC